MQRLQQQQLQMRWTRHGHIIDPRTHPSVCSHAQVPAALRLDDRIRVYYADRDQDGRSFPAYVDVDPDEPARVIDHHPGRLMSLGAPGTFDDDGVMPGYAMHHEGRILLYYSGWNQRHRVPYHNATGLAQSRDGVLFERVYEGPVMDRIPTEPQLAVTPSILKTQAGWQAWYISGLRWDLIDGHYEPVYVIKYATSRDGVYWERPAHICIPQRHPQEAFSHPTVVWHDGWYHMWFCCRHCRDFRGGAGSYRMGYARSLDGQSWERLDDLVGIAPSAGGFDSEMICYPFVMREKDHLIMFFNGNGHGQTGIGVATMPLSALETAG